MNKIEIPKILYPAHEHHEKKLRLSDKIALFITERLLGSFSFFVLCCVMVAVWAVWNIKSPAEMRFDDSQFNMWQYISSAFQIITMPLLLLVQQLQLKHAEARSEFSYLAAQRSMKENAEMLEKLNTLTQDNQQLIEQNKKLIEMMEKRAENENTIVLPDWMRLPKKRS
mgnify:CR=1 FL=1